MPAEKIDADQCTALRKQYQNGTLTIEEMAGLVDCTETTVRRHLKADCSHSGDAVYDPTDHKGRLSKADCEEIWALYGDGHTQQQIAEAVGVRRETIGVHIRGECTHRSLAHPDHEKAASFSERDCQRLRREYIDTPSSTQLAEENDCTVTTVQRHVTGDCSHSGVGVPISQTALHPYFWETATLLYTEHHFPVEEIGKLFDVSESTVEKVVAFVLEETREWDDQSETAES